MNVVRIVQRVMCVGAVTIFMTANASGQGKSAVAAPVGKAPSACQDFYTHVNAPWMRQAELTMRHIIDSSRALPEGTEDTVRTDTLRIDAFTEVGKDVHRRLRGILERARAAVPTTQDSLTRLLGTYYNSCMLTPPTDSTEAAKEKDGGTKRCVKAADEDMGTPLGLAYANEVASPSAQRRALALMEQLRASMEKRLRANQWMTPETKAAALGKLAAMTFRVGIPDSSNDYKALTLSPTDFAANRRAVKYVTYQRDLKEMSGMEKKGWLFRQYFVNAFYMPSANSIEVPAVLFQPPNFNPDKDAIENYAGIGFIIGHEITHAFDRTGARYDAKGLLKNWWSPADTLPFKTRSDGLQRQYDKYVTIDSIPVNGPLTINENIADLGGLNLAFDAFQQSPLSKSGKRVNDQTPDQQFFEKYAMTWRSVATQERAQRLARMDVHAPQQWRVNGVLANVPAFAKNFGCKPGDAMALPPAERSDIW